MAKRGKQAKHEQQVELIDVQIGIPLADPPEAYGYIARHVEIGALTLEQGRALRQVAEGVAERGLRLRSGRRVATPPDAIRWLLEQIAEMASESALV